jgi:hypothetical protein
VDSAVATIIGAAIGAVAGVGGAAVTAWRQTQMERQKSELSVWADFRNDILKDMWASHRAAVAAMTQFILRTQQVQYEGGNIADLKKDLDAYRSQIHRSIDLLTPTAIRSHKSSRKWLISCCSGTRRPRLGKYFGVNRSHLMITPSKEYVGNSLSI